MSREIELAILVKRASFLREVIASRKDYMESEWWSKLPNNHKTFYEKHEPSIIESAKELYEVEKEIEKFRPNSTQSRRR